MLLISEASVETILIIISGGSNPQRGGVGGYSLYNEGRQASLNDKATSDTYRGKTDDNGVDWYIAPNPFNRNGYLISSNQNVATNPTYCLYAYQDLDKSYYLSLVST